MIVSQVTYQVLVARNAGGQAPGWIGKLGSALFALLVCSCLVLSERVLIQLISISYHRKQFKAKIRDSKRKIRCLSRMYNVYQTDCGGTSRPRAHQSLLQNVSRFGDKIADTFGAVTQDLSGKKSLDPNSAHSEVVKALKNESSAKGLARNIWSSFTKDSKDRLCLDDLPSSIDKGEVKEWFGVLDQKNSNVSCEEMIAVVCKFQRENQFITSNIHDASQAIDALDALLSIVAFVVCIFVIICFMSPGFTATLASSATALLSLSFVFAATCQEVLGSCIFLFVKHPYDIGDRVDIGADQLTVEHISLTHTVFSRVDSGQTVQTPNIVLNSLWIENITRSETMSEQVSIVCSLKFYENVSSLKHEMEAFASQPVNESDFDPVVDVELSIADMSKLKISVKIRHKTKWPDESLRASRRSRFVCALAAALRKTQIFSSDGSDASFDDADKTP